MAFRYCKNYDAIRIQNKSIMDFSGRLVQYLHTLLLLVDS